MNMLKQFWAEEDGFAVVELLLIIAVLIVIAILFRNTIIGWVKNILGSLFPDATETTAQPTQAAGT